MSDMSGWSWNLGGAGDDHSRPAPRFTERPSVRPSVCLSVYLSVCVFMPAAAAAAAVDE